jgi:hypothetical protein
MVEGKNRELAVVVTVATVIAFAALDYLVLRIASNTREGLEWIVPALCGMIAAQTLLIAIWAVFSPVNVVLRFSCWLFLGLTTWYIVVFGMQGPYQGLNRMPSSDAVIFGGLLLAVAMLLQIPLWIAKRALRFRLIRPGESPMPVASERIQFQLKDLLIAAVILAIALSPIRLVLRDEGFNAPMLIPTLFVGVLVATAVISLATLPGLWAAFASRPAIVSVVGLSIYALFVTGIEFAAVCPSVAPRSSTSRFAAVFGVFYLANITQCLVVFTVMRLYHALGFRLQRVPRYAAPVPEAMARPRLSEAESDALNTINGSSS